MLGKFFSPNLGQGSSFGKSKIMMRAALILVGLGTLAIVELETPPRTTKAPREPLAQSTVGISESRDILTKLIGSRFPMCNMKHQLSRFHLSNEYLYRM
jgi:hypothetical protein